jgi:hypothetical protein
MGDTDIVVYKEASPVNNLANPSGFLRDNSGDLWGITGRAVDILKNDDVKPTEEVPHDGKPLPVWAIDSGGERYYKTSTWSSKGTVNKCVFNAIKQYINALSLGTLTSGDDDFFVGHPRVESEGVSRANVLMVSQGLIWPWGLGIDRVWVPKLSSIGEQHEEFMKALGVNPVALTDYETSNKDLINMLGLDPKSDSAKQIVDSYKFEFADEPERPCVVMVNGYSKKSSNVKGKWSNTVVGMGHADFIGPRDQISGSWEIAFSISRNPKYAEGVDMSGYSDLSYFDEEIKAKEEANKKAQHKDISTWSSLVGGESISNRDKKQNPPAVHVHKPGHTYQQSFNWQDTGKDDKNGKGKKDGAKKYDKCPECGSKSIRTYNDDYVFCYVCNWWEDLADPDDLYLCPFCDTEMLANGLCPNCMFDDEIWRRSQIYRCKEHDTADVYFCMVDDNNEKLDSKDFVYVCPRCLEDEGKTLDQFYKAGENHRSKLSGKGS